MSDSTTAVPPIAEALTQRELTSLPITSRLPVNSTSVTSGTGTTKLRTTWLTTRAFVASLDPGRDQHRRQHSDEPAQPERDPPVDEILHDDLTRHRADDRARQTRGEQGDHEDCGRHAAEQRPQHAIGVFDPGIGGRARRR